LGLAEVVDVAGVVVNLLDLQGIDHQAQLGQVIGQ